jgi:hypothetical protein
MARPGLDRGDHDFRKSRSVDVIEKDLELSVFQPVLSRRDAVGDRRLRARLGLREGEVLPPPR